MLKAPAEAQKVGFSQRHEAFASLKDTQIVDFSPDFIK